MSLFRKLARRKGRQDVAPSSTLQPDTISTDTSHPGTPRRSHILTAEELSQPCNTTTYEDRCSTEHRGHTFKEVSISGHSRSHIGDVHGNVTHHYWPSGPSLGVEEQEQLGAKRRVAEHKEFEDKKCIAFLKALEFEAMGSRLATISSAYVNTCAWIVETPQYTNWRDENLREDHHGVLWIKGNPGSGKSTLMKYALEVAETRDCNEAIVSFFFNARGQPIERSTEGMYRALLHQILSKLPRLYSGRIHVERKSWQVETLENMLQATLLTLKPDEHIVCYIDALDECAQDEVRDAVALFEDLGDRVVIEKIPLSICFSSRHYPHITMHKHEEIKVDSLDEHLEDISKYVQDHLSRMRITNPLKDDLETIIQRRCSGVFLWVVLVIKILREKRDEGASRPELIASLKAVPGKLQDIFASITDNPSEEMILAFQWLLYAKEQLDTVELYLAIKTGAGQLSTGKWDEADVDLESIERFHLRSARGLVEIKDSEFRRMRYPQFIHESVREHLLAGGLASLMEDEELTLQNDIHAWLAQYCLSYIQLDSPMYMRLRDGNPLELHRYDFPFLHYAVTNIFPHMETGRTGGALQIEALNTIPLEVIRSTRMIDAKMKGGPLVTPSVTLIYLLLEDRCCNLAKSILSHHSSIPASTVKPSQAAEQSSLPLDVNAQCGGYFGSALGAAVTSDSTELVQLLLNHGADPNLSPANSISPLMFAAINQFEDVAQLLISHGADVNLRMRNGDTALYEAAYIGSAALLTLLLLNGADPTVTGGKHGSPLGAAVAGRSDMNRLDSLVHHDAIICLLLDHGAQVNLWLDRSPLWIAACAHDSKMVRYLLDLGADVDARDDFRAHTPLHVSASAHPRVGWSGEVDRVLTMKNLLDGGADVNAVAKHGSTPLIAVSQQYASKDTLTVIQLLLDHGANVWHRGEDGTALDVAWSFAKGGYNWHDLETVRLLWNATFPESDLAERAFAYHRCDSQRWFDTRSIHDIYHIENADGSHDGLEDGDGSYYSDEDYDTDQSYESDASVRSAKTV